MAKIVLDRVDKVYSGGVKAVDGLDLEIHDGEFMVLVGPLALVARRRPPLPPE